MKLFENGVGRPSNEIKKKRKIFIASAIVLCVALVSVLSFALTKVSTGKMKGATNTSGKTTIDKLRKEIYDFEHINMELVGITNIKAYNWDYFDSKFYEHKNGKYCKGNFQIKTTEKGNPVTPNIYQVEFEYPSYHPGGVEMIII